MLNEQKELELVEVLKELMTKRAMDYGYTLYEACLEEQNCDAIFMDIFNSTFNDFEADFDLSLDDTILIKRKVVKDVLGGHND